MRSELKWMIHLVGLGMGLVAYAHTTFATKSIIELIYSKLNVIDARVYEIHKAMRSTK